MIATRADDELFRSLLDDLTNTTSNQLVDVPLSGNRWFVWTSASIYSLLALAALIANSLFCYVIWRSKKLHTVTHMLMTNLGICNVFFLLFHPAFFMTTYIFQTNWILGTFICKMSFSTVYVTATGSFYFMSLVSVDRWLAIFRRRQRLTNASAGVLTAIAWLLSLCIAAPYFVFSGVLSDDYSAPLILDRRTHCAITCEPCRRPLLLVSVSVQYCIPLMLMMPAYTHLAVFLWRRPDVGAQTKEKHRRARQRKRKMLIVLISILGSLILGWSPFFGVGLLHSYKLISTDSLTLYICTSILSVIAVLLTPLLYLMNDSFRSELLRLLPFCIGRRALMNSRQASHTADIGGTKDQSSSDENRRTQSGPLLVDQLLPTTPIRSQLESSSAF